MLEAQEQVHRDDLVPTSISVLLRTRVPHKLTINAKTISQLLTDHHLIPFNMSICSSYITATLNTVSLAFGPNVSEGFTSREIIANI